MTNPVERISRALKRIARHCTVHTPLALPVAISVDAWPRGKWLGGGKEGDHLVEMLITTVGVGFFSRVARTRTRMPL